MAITSLGRYDRASGNQEVGSITGVVTMPRPLISNLLGLVGAIVGGALGFYTFGWLMGQGFYGLMIPGAFLGLGCGLLAQHSSIARGIVCGVAALILALFTEWQYFPFLADSSLSYFVQHLTDLRPVTILMTVIGAAIAFWVGKDAGFRWLPEGRKPAPAEPKQDPMREV
jgi:hypothetical protein